VVLALAVAFALALGACSTNRNVVGRLSPSSVASSEATSAMVDERLARDLEVAVRRSMKKEGIEGLAIVVAARDGSSWSAGFGSAGRGRPVTPGTPFIVASVTKLFTAVAVMTLVEDGLVDLDDPIGVYVPEMAGARYPGSLPPTVRDILTHHGGLVSDLLKGNLYDGPASGFSEAFMVHMPVIASQPLTEPPRTLAHYSNVGYVLLGALVANVSGEPYADYVARRVLEPLGMSNSGFGDPASNESLSAGFASGKEVKLLRMSGLPEGGLAASATDLGRFLSMLLAGGSAGLSGPAGERVIGTSSPKEMMRRQNSDVALDFDFEMGLGFHLMTLPGYPDVRIAWHDGGTYPWASTFIVAPDYGAGVALLSNSDEKVPAELAYRAMAKVIERANGATLRRTGGYRFGEMAGRALDSEELPGTYASAIGAVVVGAEPGAPTLTMAGHTLSLVAREQDSYGLQARLLGFIPLPMAELARIRLVFREIGGHRVLAYYESGKFRSVALAVEPEPVPAVWAGRYGDYTAVNADPHPFFLGARLGFDDKLQFMTLTVHIAASPKPLVIPVKAVDDSTLVSAGLGRHMGETLRVQRENGEERIIWAGLKLKR